MATKTDANGNVVTFELDTKNTYVGETMAFNINVTTSGIDTSDATATAEDIKLGKTAYVDGALITGIHEEESFETEEKTITPSESIQTVTPSSDKDGLSKVTVNAIDSNYVGSAITKDPTVTVNGNVVSVPSGYYSNAITSTVAEGSLGTVTAAKSAVSNNAITITPQIAGGVSGYITETEKTGSSVSVSASELVSGNLSLKPTETAQNDVDVTNYATVSVEAVGEYYVGSAVPTLEATIYTPTTIDQTIAARTYLTGAQTIQGDANLIPANIAKGISIFGVVGTNESGVDTSDATAEAADIAKDKTAYVNGQKVTGTAEYQSFYTGEDTPASTLGEDGDLYFKTSGDAVTGSSVGVISSTDNSISLMDDQLASGTYTMYYEDSTGSKLDGWSAIGTITKQRGD